MKRRWCGAIPQRGTVDASQVPSRATCICGQPITYVDGLINQAPHWRHHPKRRTIQ